MDTTHAVSASGKRVRSKATQQSGGKREGRQQLSFQCKAPGWNTMNRWRSSQVLPGFTTGSPLNLQNDRGEVAVRLDSSDALRRERKRTQEAGILS